MWLTSKIKQVLMVLKPGVVTLKYPFEPRPAPEGLPGRAALGPHQVHRLRRLRQPLPGPDDHGPRPVPGDPGDPLRRLALHLLRPLRRRLPGEGHRHDRPVRAGDGRPERHHREPGALHADLPALRPLLRHGDDERDRQAGPDGIPLRQPGGPDRHPQGDRPLRARGARSDRALRAARARSGD